MRSNKALGRGLSSLLREDIAPIDGQGEPDELGVELIYANPNQPRKRFNTQKIEELSASIAEHGVVQPIIVTKDGAGKYQIVAGERRYRAAKLAELSKVPVIVKNFDEQEIFEIALIENIQRDELTAIEEAEGYKKLIDNYKYTPGEIAQSLGKSRSHIANLLRLNHLPESIKEKVNDGQLSMGHARCLIGVANAESLMKKIITEGLSVRKTEELVSLSGKLPESRSKQKTRKKPEQSEDLKMLSASLSEKFKAKVRIEGAAESGKISIFYESTEELDKILSSF